MKRYGNLYGEIASRDNVMLAYLKARRGKSKRRDVCRFESDLENNIDWVQDLLAEKEYQPSDYRIKVIYEPKRRKIYIAPFAPDRIVHHALMNILEPIWDKIFIADSYACRRGYGLHAGSRRTMEFIRKVGRDGYCLKMDISKFYPSIDHDIMFEIIQKKIKCQGTLDLIRKIIYSIADGKNIPIGNYTSQWFGNLYLNEVDYYIKHQLRMKYYVRYCDDFIVFHRDKRYLRNLKANIGGFLHERLRLKFSKAEVSPIRHGIDFLGYRHFLNYVLLRKSTAKRMRKHLVSVTSAYQKGHISQEVFRSVIGSISGWLRWTNSYHLRQSFNIGLLWEIANA